MATTFRLDDQRVYFLDRSGSVLRLCRFRTSARQLENGVEILAELPVAWNDYARFTLVVGAEGDLLLAASNHTADPSKDVLLARFSVSLAGRLSFLGRAYGTYRLVGDPVLTSAGIAVGALDSSTVTLRTVNLSSLDPAPRDAPTVL